MFKNKKVILAGTILVASAIIVAGTFAWFTDSDEVVNKMKLANFDVKITEEWIEEENQNLEPDATVDKVVKIANNGTADAVVRVSIEEKLKLFKVDDNNNLIITWLTEQSTDEKYVAVPDYIFPDDPQNLTDDPETDEINEIIYYTAITSLKEDDTQYYVVKDEIDGLARINPEDKEPVVEYAYYEYAEDFVGDLETLEDGSIGYFNPEFNDTDWVKVGDYYYYNKIVKSGEVTNPLFSEVKVSEKLPNTYIGSIYTLTPKMEAVQANKKAIESEWVNEVADLGDLIKNSWGLEEVTGGAE